MRTEAEKRALGLPAIGSETDLLQMWLHGKATLTRDLYEREARALLAFSAKPIGELALGDLQAYQRSFIHLKSSTRATKTGIIKSLLTFAAKVGYTDYNASLMLEAPKVNSRLTDRIIEEDGIQRMIELETDPRNNILLRLLYMSGCRVSEVAAMRLGDFRARGREGQVTVIGKGSKERTILLARGVWQRLEPMIEGPASDYLFPSRRGGGLKRGQITKIVKAAAVRAGLSERVSSHWMRHANASHALDNGAPLSLVQTSLGHASVSTTSRYLHSRPSDSTSRYLKG